MTSKETAAQSLRVVSLIASATEIVCALGRGDWLVGRSHECDYPPAVARLPALTAPKFKVEGSSGEIDRRVREIVRDGLSVYRVDADALSALAPDLIVTQDHCDVCAVSLRDVQEAVCRWTDRRVEILSLRPDCLADAYADIGRVARALAAEAQGAGLVAGMERRLRALAVEPVRRRRPRVAFIEWVEPLMAGGNWMPELIEAAGGHNLFGVAGEPSRWMSWDKLVAADPEVIIVAPCGFGLDRCLAELPLLQAKPGWTEIDAVLNGRVFFADGNAYFNRPGPRLADSGEILAQVLHGGPELSDHGTVAWVRHKPPAAAGLS
jgi:iron complex transport system substrate-binding protein